MTARSTGPSGAPGTTSSRRGIAARLRRKRAADPVRGPVLCSGGPRSAGSEERMTRFLDWTPRGVIPAVLLPFHADYSVDAASYRRHLRDVGGIDGISALTVNGHSSEVHACTRDE